MGKVKEFITHFVGARDVQAYFYAAKCMTYIEGGDTSVEIALEVEGGG